jgi:hypothetical protein
MGSGQALKIRFFQNVRRIWDIFKAAHFGMYGF